MTTASYSARMGAAAIEHDDDVTAALKLIGKRARYHGRELCPRCTSRYVSTANADVCTICQDELAENDRAAKRRWWARRHAQDATQLQAAKTWLSTELRRGPRPSRDLKAKARAVGITESTLKRAKLELGVNHHRERNGPDHRTVWELPKHDATQTNTAESELSQGGD